MKFGVVIFPGSNCDHDMLFVLQEVMGGETVPLWHKEHDLQGCDFIVLPGGFSYGDYLRCGAVARFSPIMEEVVQFAKKGGNVWGICNGFQVLCEAHLLPGVLLRNQNQRFICKNSFIKPANSSSLLTRGLQSDEVLKIPVAHAEGRYFARPETLEEMKANDQVLFHYCNEAGELTDEANANGSVENIAGVMNEQGNVFGMMPHPERAADEGLGNTDGRKIFESILNMVKA